MLVLSRKRDRGLTIRTPDGYEIKVVVVDIRGDKTRLGIDAHRDVTIYRDELQDVIDREAA